MADFPGITVTEDGQIQLKSADSRVNVFSSEYRKAIAACRHLLPSGSLPSGSEVPAGPDPVTPSAPALGFSCDGTCPRRPEAPEPPS
ncbi:hypothetical protein [Actinoplanes sp. NPDC051851]|uniref:hypothetical protein n=1 Tax=Actinoplanes sp. NPDC051851 TaxID=3154753 RepID=UPI00341E03E6